MANSLVAIANGQTALELGLAGVRVEEAREPRDAEKVLEGLLESDAQMVIVQEDFRGKFSEWFENRLARHGGLPLVIYCPAFDQEDAGTDAYINAIVRPAVGFEIRLDT